MRNRRLALALVVLIWLLLVGGAVAAQDSAPPTQPTYTVQRGDNLFRIALRYGISTQSLIEANGITNPSRIFAGQQLIIPNFDASGAVVENPLIAGSPITHVVQSGETLARIARDYGMTLEQIMQINNLTNPDVVYRGQQLTVWDVTGTQAPSEQPAAEVNVQEPISPAVAETTTAMQATYTVRPGEHLAQIARRFGVTWEALAEANGLNNPNQIFAGQVLNVPESTAAADLGIVTASFPIPQPTITVGRQIVVDLSDQMLYAFQDGQLVRSARVSTGLPATPTVLGDYKVYLRYRAQTMSGPGYYLTDVPYVMYFYQGYGLHGTYWHNNFGRPMSHGCVNLPTPEAQWLYDNFVEIGTPVRVIV